jgi:hypothetical protein
MSSAGNDSGKSNGTGPGRAFERWNRKLHFYAGLFLLFFTWLFALTGLLLNHPSWSFDEYWKNRHETKYERALTPFAGIEGDLGQARDIMRQIGITGEILWTTTRTNPDLFEFQVRRPGHYLFLNANLAQAKVTVRDAEVNVWGVMKVLHTFSGVQMDDPRNRRDWALTSMWALSMDVVAAGLIFMVLSSLYMWFRLPEKRVGGVVALGLGAIACGLFCFGLRWMF